MHLNSAEKGAIIAVVADIVTNCIFFQSWHIEHTIIGLIVGAVVGHILRNNI